MVGDCGDRTLEGPSGSGRGSYSRRSLRPAGGRQRLNLKPEGEALLKLPQRARMVLQSPDTRPWGFGSQVHTPLALIFVLVVGVVCWIKPFRGAVELATERRLPHQANRISVLQKADDVGIEIV